MHCGRMGHCLAPTQPNRPQLRPSRERAFGRLAVPVHTRGAHTGPIAPSKNLHEEVPGLTTQRVPGRGRTIGVGFLAAGTAIAGVITGLGVPSSASEANHSTAAAVAAPNGPNYLAAAACLGVVRFGSWTAGPVTSGTPAKAPFCLDGVFDSSDTGNRAYFGKSKVAAEELVSVLSDTASADALVTKLQTKIQGCYQQWLNMDIPAYRSGKRSASWARYASPGDTATTTRTVYGVFTVPPTGFDHATNLFAVGKRGNSVMVLHLVLVGDRADAPVEQFRATASAALAALY